MNIARLGPLKPDSQLEGWLVSEPVSVPYFDGQLFTFTLDGLTEADIGDVQVAVEAFLGLNSDARRAASRFVFENYRQTVEEVGDDQVDCHIDSPDDVWTHVHPTEIFVSRRHRRDRLIYIQITAECDWEGEHGLQIVYRSGVELARVSSQDGHLTHADAYDIPEDQDRVT